MTKTLARAVLLGLVTGGMMLFPLTAQADEHEATGDEAGADMQAEGGQENTPETFSDYLTLRYDEDYSYLKDAPEGYEPDFFDPVKYMDLGEGWSLSLGGSARVRLMVENDRFFGVRRDASDFYQLYQVLAHADLKYEDTFRLFVEGIMAFDEDQDNGTPFFDENQWDLHQAFMDFNLGGKCNLVLRVGRQEMEYGSGRMVSANSWFNTRQRFDAIKLMGTGEDFDLDVFWARVPVIDNDGWDDWEDKTDFAGAYLAFHGWPDHGLDLYYFWLSEGSGSINPNFRFGDRRVHTVGARFWGQPQHWDYELEGALQFGDWADDDIFAYFVAAQMGYTFAHAPWTPRLGMAYEMASGDEDPRDGDAGTFTQLFPDGHKYFGYLDLIGRQNIHALTADLSAKPVDSVEARLAWHMFCLENQRDALYDAHGRAVRRGLFVSDSDVGQELDATIRWDVCPHSSLLFGWSHLFAGDFIDNSAGSDDDPDLFYFQYEFKF